MIVAFAGKAGSGKDTAADVLVEEYKYKKVALADHIKRICMDVFGFSQQQLWGPSSDRNGVDDRYTRRDGEGLTPRFALQRLGTEWGRECSPTIWIRIVLRTCQALMSGGYDYSQEDGLIYTPRRFGSERISKIVVPDVRFSNEADALMCSGALVVRLHRDNDSSPSTEIAEHESEKCEHLPSHVEMYNEGTLEEFRDSVRHLAHGWGLG